MSSLHLRPLTAVLPFIVAACATQSAAAHDDRCAVIAASVEEAGFSDTVSVICEDGHASIVSDTYPDHEMMTGIVGTNEQVPVPADGYAAPIPLETTLGDTPQTRDRRLASRSTACRSMTIPPVAR